MGPAHLQRGCEAQLLHVARRREELEAGNAGDIDAQWLQSTWF